MTTVQTSAKSSDKTNIKQDDVAGTPAHLARREIVLPKDADGFYKMPDDGLRYSPEECSAVALRGFLVGAIDRVSRDNGAFTVLVFHTTAPTKAIDIEGNLVDVPVNARVDIVATVKLRQYIRFANHPTKCMEFKVQPIKQKKIGGGRAMWTYEVGMLEGAVKRPDFYPVITQQQNVAASGIAASDEAPF